jgi:hypothetical protein
MITGLINYIDEVYGAYLRLKALTNCEDYYLNELAEEASERDITLLELINEKIMEVYFPKKSIKEKIFRIFRRKNTRK